MSADMADKPVHMEDERTAPKLNIYFAMLKRLSFDHWL